MIEFLLILPFCLLVFAILHDVGRMYLVKSSLARTTSGISDILSENFKPQDVDFTVPGKIDDIFLMFQVFMFPEEQPRPYANVTAAQKQNFSLFVLGSGTNGIYICLSANWGSLPIPPANIAFSHGSTQPEVVVGANYKFKLPLLSNFLNLIRMGPTMTLTSVSRRFMRGVMLGSGGNVITQPLKGPGTSDPTCVVS